MKLISQILAAAVVAGGVAVALPGCTNSKIPGDASLVARGVGDTTYIAGHSGTLYVYDKSWDKMVYSGRVEAGQRVELSAHRDKLLVDGIPRVEQIPLGEGSEYQFFLRYEPTVVRRTIIEEVPARTYERRTVVEPAPIVERRTVIERDIR